MSASTATAAQMPSDPQYVMVPIQEKNGLGAAGFIIAFIGLFIPTGIVAVLGLLISLAALGRAPRGLATLGVITGLFGTVAWLGLMVLAVMGVLVAGAVVVVGGMFAFVLTQPEVVEVSADMINTTVSVIEYEEAEGDLPESLGVLGLSVSMLTDPWGNPYRYFVVDEPDEDDELGFDIVSCGMDGEFGNADDVILSQLPEYWSGAWKSFEGKFGELMERLEKIDDRASRGGRNVRFSYYERHARDTVQRELASDGDEASADE